MDKTFLIVQPKIKKILYTLVWTELFGDLSFKS
jgi:hypothetical protein